MRCHKNFVHPQLFMQIGSPLATLNCSMIFLHLKQPRKKCSKIKKKRNFLESTIFFSKAYFNVFFFFFWRKNGKWLRDHRDCWFYPLMYCTVIVQQIEHISAQSTMQEQNIRFWAYCTKKERQKKNHFSIQFFFYY